MGFVGSAVGDIKILEVNQDGKFVRLVNEGMKVGLVLFSCFLKTYLFFKIHRLQNKFWELKLASLNDCLLGDKLNSTGAHFVVCEEHKAWSCSRRDSNLCMPWVTWVFWIVAWMLISLIRFCNKILEMHSYWTNGFTIGKCATL